MDAAYEQVIKNAISEHAAEEQKLRKLSTAQKEDVQSHGLQGADLLARRQSIQKRIDERTNQLLWSDGMGTVLIKRVQGTERKITKEVHMQEALTRGSRDKEAKVDIAHSPPSFTQHRPAAELAPRPTDLPETADVPSPQTDNDIDAADDPEVPLPVRLKSDDGLKLPAEPPFARQVEPEDDLKSFTITDMSPTPDALGDDATPSNDSAQTAEALETVVQTTEPDGQQDGFTDKQFRIFRNTYACSSRRGDKTFIHSCSICGANAADNIQWTTHGYFLDGPAGMRTHIRTAHPIQSNGDPGQHILYHAVSNEDVVLVSQGKSPKTPILIVSRDVEGGSMPFEDWLRKGRKRAGHTAEMGAKRRRTAYEECLENVAKAQADYAVGRALRSRQAVEETDFH